MDKDKQPTDKPITVRIPLDLLEKIEAKASDRYPSRKGSGGNRSQVILDALGFYQSNGWGEGEDSLKKPSGDLSLLIDKAVTQRIQGLTDSLESLIDKALDKRLQSVQGNNFEGLQGDTSKALQCVQGNRFEELQSVQSIIENHPSQNALEDHLKEENVETPLTGTEAVKGAISEEKPKKGRTPSSPRTEEEIKGAIADLSMGWTAKDLDIRLGKGKSWVSKNKDKENFEGLTQSLDPDGFSWHLGEDKKFYPKK